MGGEWRVDPGVKYHSPDQNHRLGSLRFRRPLPNAIRRSYSLIKHFLGCLNNIFNPLVHLAHLTVGNDDGNLDDAVGRLEPSHFAINLVESACGFEDVMYSD